MLKASHTHLCFHCSLVLINFSKNCRQQRAFSRPNSPNNCNQGTFFDFDVDTEIIEKASLSYCRIPYIWMLYKHKPLKSYGWITGSYSLSVGVSALLSQENVAPSMSNASSPEVVCCTLVSSSSSFAKNSSRRVIDMLSCKQIGSRISKTQSICSGF